MSDRDEKMALWLAFAVREFSSDELQTLTTTLQTKIDELKEIVGD